MSHDRAQVRPEQWGLHSMEQKGNGVMTPWFCENGANRPICSIVSAEQRNSSEHCYVLPLKKLTQHYPKGPYANNMTIHFGA